MCYVTRSLRFTSGATPANLLAASMAAEPSLPHTCEALCHLFYNACDVPTPPRPPMDKITDRDLQNHCLPAPSLAGGNYAHKILDFFKNFYVKKTVKM